GPVAEPVPLPTATSVPAGVGLTADELATAAGADPVMVGQLREFGLISPVVLGGVEYFDEAALAVAKLAVAFAAFGIEPRHLRLYKHATEREAGFVEQVVLPLLRQRNPEARSRAAATAAELARLGQALRTELMHQALVALLGHDAVTS
ncbi:MAG: MerR family transcriptional regulator, partial [Acidimicrobiales bacterium]